MPQKVKVQLEAVASFAGDYPDVPLAEDVQYEALVAPDIAAGQQPMFVTLPLATFGQVSRNQRVYGETEVRRMYERIMENAITGNNGHMRNEDRSYNFDIPAVKWVGAAIEGDQLWGKLYVLGHREDVREYFRVQKATNGRVGTSIYGTGYEVWDEEAELYRISDFDLEQIDIVHPDRVGVPFAATLPPRISAETEGTAFAERLRHWIDENTDGGQARSDLVQRVADAAGVAVEIVEQCVAGTGITEADTEQLQNINLPELARLAEDHLSQQGMEDNHMPESNQNTRQQPDESQQILELREAHQEQVRDLNRQLQEAQASARTLKRLREMLGVSEEGQDPVLALQALQVQMETAARENRDLLQTAVESEVAKHVPVAWVRGTVIEQVKLMKPQTRAEVVACVQEALRNEHIALILKNAVQQELGPKQETPATKAAGENHDGSDSSDDAAPLIIIPGMGGN